MIRRFSAQAIALALAWAFPAHGSVMEFIANKASWQAAAGPIQTIDFTGHADGTVIAAQYFSMGIVFTDGDDVIDASGSAFPNDGFGLAGGLGPPNTITIALIAPRYAIAVEYPGAMRIELYQGGELLYVSSNFGGVGSGNFAGLVSSEAFDLVVLRDWHDSHVFIDDLHLGELVLPSPGGLLLLASWLALPARRRRTGQHLTP